MNLINKYIKLTQSTFLSLANTNVYENLNFPLSLVIFTLFNKRIPESAAVPECYSQGDGRKNYCKNNDDVICLL